MDRPARLPLSPSLLFGGAAAIVVGSRLPWARVAIDLSRLFPLFPSEYPQVLRGPQLDVGVTFVLGVAILLAGMVWWLVPRVRPPALWTALGGGLAALMTGLFHLIRLRPVALEALTEGSGRDAPVLSAAAVHLELGLFVVIAGALVTLAGGVLLLADRGLRLDEGLEGGERSGGNGAGPDL